MLVFRRGTGNDIQIPPGVIIAIKGFKASECWCIFCPQKKTRRNTRKSLSIVRLGSTPLGPRNSHHQVFITCLEIFIVDLFKMLGKRNTFYQMVVKDGDESHGTIRKKEP